MASRVIYEEIITEEQVLWVSEWEAKGVTHREVVVHVFGSTSFDGESGAVQNIEAVVTKLPRLGLPDDTVANVTRRLRGGVTDPTHVVRGS